MKPGRMAEPRIGASGELGRRRRVSPPPFFSAAAGQSGAGSRGWRGSSRESGSDLRNASDGGEGKRCLAGEPL